MRGKETNVVLGDLQSLQNDFGNSLNEDQDKHLKFGEISKAQSWRTTNTQQARFKYSAFDAPSKSSITQFDCEYNQPLATPLTADGALRIHTDKKKETPVFA
jgi:hypothetical protein